MGKASRTKGGVIEREIVHRHAEIGVYAEKVPDSGASKYRGTGHDIDVYIRGRDAAPIVTEVKARKNGEGFTVIERWLSDYDALFLRRNAITERDPTTGRFVTKDAPPLVVLPWSTWKRLVSPRLSTQVKSETKRY